MNFKKLAFTLLCLCLMIHKGYSISGTTACAGDIVPVPPCAISFVTAYPGGIWTSSNTTIATVDSYTGIVYTSAVTTVSNVVISYSETDACGNHVFSYQLVVNPLPTAITGLPGICVGANTILTGTPSGGSWSSSNTSVAAIGSLSGLVNGISAGPAIITYTLPTGCYLSTPFTVYALPAPIVGPSSVCVGTSITLTDASSGGTWTSSDPSIALVDPMSGVVTGVNAGIVTITYTSAAGCSTSLTVTVTASPGSISGPTTICLGQVATLTNAVPGGTWSSSGPAVSVNPSTGVITGVSSGSATITYTTPAGCTTSILVTVITSFNLQACETSPIQVCGSSFTYCGAGFTFKVTGAPGGTYNWSPALPFSASSTAVVAGVVETTYTITGGLSEGSNNYTVSSSLSCGTPLNITIVVPNGSCNPCQAFHPSCVSCSVCATPPAFKTITATTLDASVISASTPDYYFIANSANITVNPASGSVFMMNKNTSLTVPGGAIVILDSIHLTSAPQCPWYGVRVNATATIPGRLTTKHNTLIENAKGNQGPGASFGAIMVDGVSGGSLAPSGNDILTIGGTIFNNDTVGIEIRNYYAHDTLPFTINSSVFTNRDFSCYHTASPATATDYYPYVWPGSALLRAPNAATGTVNNPGFAVDAFPAITNNNLSGIDLQYVGKTHPGSPNAYARAVIGDLATPANNNLFDTTKGGITMRGSNVTCYNNVIRRTALNTSGIDAQRGVFNYNYRMESLQLLNGSTDGTNNRFYNCNVGVSTWSYYDILCRNTFMSATNYMTDWHSPFIVGSTGFYISDTMFGQHDIVNDTIVNIADGINANGSGYYLSGTFNISGNVIKGISSSSDFAYMNRGIIVDYNSISSTTSGNISVTNNQISGAIFGVHIATSNALNKVIDNNTIIIRNNGATPQSRIGINAEYSSNITSISGNNIVGDILNGVDFNTPVCSYSAPTLNGTTGIFLTKVNYLAIPAVVSCNIVRDVPIGFKFMDNSSLSWQRNTMMRNRIGMLLHGQGTTLAKIGIQGASCAPADNVWDGPASGSWPGWGAYLTPVPALALSDSTFQTYVLAEDAPAAGSDMFVRLNPSMTIPPFYTPTHNGRSALSLIPYSIATGGTITISGCASPYLPCSGSGPYSKTRNDGSTTDVSTNTSRMNENEQVVVFPNPSHGTITIRGHLASDIQSARVEVVDIRGKVVFRENVAIQNNYMDKDLLLGKGLANGVYMLRISSDKTNTTLRFTLDQ
jgi:uncharacterized protein YjdB